MLETEDTFHEPTLEPSNDRESLRALSAFVGPPSNDIAPLNGRYGEQIVYNHGNMPLTTATYRNIPCMPVTRDTSHAPIEPLKDSASLHLAVFKQ
jgi:hypothetical protein